MDCPICLSEITQDCMVTYCNHKFHRQCILEWKNSKEDANCPVCRNNVLILIEDIDINTMRKNLIDLMMYNRNLTEQLKITQQTYIHIYEDRQNLHRQVELLTNRIDIITKILAVAGKV